MPLLPFLAVGLHQLTGWGVWLWLGPIVILGIVPLIDWAAGLDPSNPPDSVIKALEQDRYYRWLTWVTVPLPSRTYTVSDGMRRSRGVDSPGPSLRNLHVSDEIGPAVNRSKTRTSPRAWPGGRPPSCRRSRRRSGR